MFGAGRTRSGPVWHSDQCGSEVREARVGRLRVEGSARAETGDIELLWRAHGAAMLAGASAMGTAAWIAAYDLRAQVNRERAQRTMRRLGRQGTVRERVGAAFTSRRARRGELGERGELRGVGDVAERTARLGELGLEQADHGGGATG